MNGLAIILSSAAGAVAGGFFGFWWGLREGGDFNIAPAIYGPFGSAVGAFAGAVIGVVVFG